MPDTALPKRRLGAALELADIDRYRMQGFATSDGEFAGHDFIYVPQYDLIISNAQFGTLRGRIGGTAIDCDKLGSFKYIDFIEHGGKWAYLWRTSKSSPFYGTLSPGETIEILEYLRGIHNDDIQCRRWEGGKFVKIPFEKVKQQLIKEQEHWRPHELPPYGIP